ncbi:MAG: hypothetical protein QM500_07895 [Methylococcales bacterium]
MAILLCNKCSYLHEVSNDFVGKTVSCPVCKEPAPIHNTTALVKNVITRYQTLLEKYKELKTRTTSLKDIEYVESLEDDIDLHNTSAMTDLTQFKPIIDWFEKKNITLDIDIKTIDTQGFFDEVAVALGENYQLLKTVNDQIKRSQRKGYGSASIAISKYSQKEIQALTQYCKTLYNFSFVAKYFYNKQEKRIHLTLQQAPSVLNFFNGEWLEWFVFMKLLILFYEKKVPFSALRSFKIYFPNEDQHEVDVFFLINNDMPLFIECKSGEFRSTIEKYQKLRKRMGIDKQKFTMLVLGVTDEQVKGLTSMYDITFVNENNFIAYFSAML